MNKMYMFNAALMCHISEETQNAFESQEFLLKTCWEEWSCLQSNTERNSTKTCLAKQEWKVL